MPDSPFSIFNAQPVAPSVLSLQAPPMPQLPGRGFGDVSATRNAIFDSVRTAAQEFQPVANSRYTLQLGGVDYAGPDTFSLQAQKKAVLTGQSLTRKLRGTWSLVDNATGQPIARKTTTIADVPFMTERGTFIHNGNEYALINQMRLRSGVFTRQKANGELESHVNAIPGKGITHHIFMDPETGVFKFNIGQANIPLISVLDAMGVRDSEIRESWGNDLYAANRKKASPSDIEKLYRRLVARGVAQTSGEKMQAIKAALEATQLDPEVTRRTLGEEFHNVNSKQMLRTARKILAVANRKNPELLKKLGIPAEESDDRDALAYMRLYGPEDLFAERITKSHGLARQLLWKATARGNLDNIQTGTLNKALHAALISSGLGSPIESTNPAQIFEQQGRVTRMGEGGLPGIDSVPDSARNVQASHLGFIDPLQTAESLRVGVDLRMSQAARKGEDGRVYTQVRDIKTGQPVWKTAQEIADSVLAFPGELRRNTPYVSAIANGHLRLVPREKVDFEIPHMERAFGAMSNLIPMKSAVKGQRAVMASRMTTQALSLVNGESPFVQSGTPEDPQKSFEDEYGKYLGAIKAEKSGKVLAVNSDSLELQYDDGTQETIPLYNNFPFNRRSYMHQEPLATAGQRFAAGALLAKSNYVDDRGAVALGINARVGYLPFRGLNFEDAIVISQGMADRLVSNHMYQHEQEHEEGDKLGKANFMTLFPGKFERKSLDKLDDHGVVKVGTEVHYGDPLVLTARKRERTAGQVHRGHSAAYKDVSQTWEHSEPGIVTDVERTKNGIVVAVKSRQTMHVGDKLSGRMGDKGVIAGIIPDSEMPQDEQGRPLEILANPLGVISRGNPSQIVEAALGKIAERTGKRYKVQDFENISDLTEFAIRELRQHGLSDKETVTDPVNGRKIPNILVGNRFFMKLHHSAESKGQGRSFGGYTADEMPSKGGASGAKRVALLELNALLSHGVSQVVRDSHLIRGQKNQDYWSAVMAGFPPPAPRVPFVYEKFVNQLRAAGINPVRDGTRTHVMALTDKDVSQLAGDREIQNTSTVDWKNQLQPIAGGFFDEKLTGGPSGNRWSSIRLHEPFPNPVMEDPIRRILGLTKDRFADVIAGKADLNGARGPAAIARALQNINLDKEIENARQEIHSGRKSYRDDAVRKLGYLKSAKAQGLHPRDWVLSRVPVLPPVFRPVAQMAGKAGKLVADPNYLYKELFEANQNLSEISALADDPGEERLQVYKAFKAVTGLGDPIQPRTQEKQISGVLRHVFGKHSPKYGMVQRRLLSSTTDLVGRAVITPNPDLDMDSVAIPETKAWDVYQPFIIRNLVRQGVPRLRAASAVQAREEIARKALLAEMAERPVLITRAPVLHRYGIVAAWPRLSKGETLQISPLIISGLGADFDGDAMQYHVPASDEARDEAIAKMLPSRNLLSASNFGIHMRPSQEYLGGLYAASTKQDEAPVRTFATPADAIRAYREGRIGVGQRVEIVDSRR